jgi:hypothetical protein
LLHLFLAHVEMGEGGVALREEESVTGEPINASELALAGQFDEPLHERLEEGSEKPSLSILSVGEGQAAVKIEKLPAGESFDVVVFFSEDGQHWEPMSVTALHPEGTVTEGKEQQIGREEKETIVHIEFEGKTGYIAPVLVAEGEEPSLHSLLSGDHVLKVENGIAEAMDPVHYFRIQEAEEKPEGSEEAEELEEELEEARKTEWPEPAEKEEEEVEVEQPEAEEPEEHEAPEAPVEEEEEHEEGEHHDPHKEGDAPGTAKGLGDHHEHHGNGHHEHEEVPPAATKEEGQGQGEKSTAKEQGNGEQPATEKSEPHSPVAESKSGPKHAAPTKHDKHDHGEEPAHPHKGGMHKMAQMFMGLVGAVGFATQRGKERKKREVSL